MKQPDWGSQWVVDEKNKPIWLANWTHVMSRQANFSTHKGACSWNRLVQQICPWSLLPQIKPVWYEGVKLGSNSFVAQHIFFTRNRWCRRGSFAPWACCRSVLREQAPSCVPALKDDEQTTWNFLFFIKVSYNHRTFLYMWSEKFLHDLPLF